jgi:GntR family transcriptional regulator, arabinose operon transcriptional repressor
MVNAVEQVVPRKTEMVKGAILKHISSSRLSPGSRILGENELTRQLGVSRNTVREAVGALVHEGILYRRRGSGTYLGKFSEPAGGQAEKKSTLSLRIGLLAFCDEMMQANPYVAHIMKGLTQTTELAPKIELKILTSYPQHRNMGGFYFMEAGLENQVDCLVVGVNVGVTEEQIRELSDRGITVVFLTYEPLFPGYPWVCQDVTRGVQDLTKKVYAAGHRRMGMMLYKPVSEGFLMGYMMGHRLIGQECDLDCVVFNQGREELIPEMTDRLLARGVDSVLCYDDETAISVIRYLSRKGVKVPEDVAVIGINDTADPNGGADYPPLTTIRMPMEEMGRACRDLLVMSKLGQNSSARSIVLPSELVIRKTGLGNLL